MIWRGAWQLAMTLCLVCPLAAQAPTDGAALPVGFVRIERASLSTGGLSVRISLPDAPRTVADLLSEIARQARLVFAADPTLPGMELMRSPASRDLPARDAILRVLQDTPLMALISRGGQIVIVPRNAYPLRPMTAADSRRRVRISGFVRNRDGREVIRRAQLLTQDGVRAESNDEGFFVLTLPVGAHRVRVRAIGFAPSELRVEAEESLAQDVLLTQQLRSLAAVTVRDSVEVSRRSDLDPRAADMSVVRLSSATVKALPPLLGEPDPMRSLATLPGVALTSDASTSFSVRGGSADQNLYLLDEATVYNPSHILGFLSSFNTDAVDNVTLYKGAIPARFGGRVTSVVDVRQREGNADRFVGSAGIGLLASRAALEGPLPRHRGSFMLAGRHSYLDLFRRFARDSVLRDSRANFYDLNGRVTVPTGQRGQVLVSGYVGRDLFSVPSRSSASWGNRTGTTRWNQAFGSRVFSSVTAAFGQYDYRIEAEPDVDQFARWTSQIRNIDLKVDQTVTLSSSNAIEFGIHLGEQRIQPASVVSRNILGGVSDIFFAPRIALQPSAYLGQRIALAGDRVSVHWGIRYSDYQRKGPGTVFRYRDDRPVTFNSALLRYERGELVDSVVYASGATISRYGGWEPRVSARWTLTPASSLKASFARTQQFLSLATRTNSITPLDVWEPAGPYLRPQRSDQVAVGYARTTSVAELSVESYVRRTANTVDFIDGADLLLNPRVETLLLQGDGRAYGLELFARRNTGTLTGWIGYTLSRSEQRFPLPANASGTLAGGINAGRYYPTLFDRTHNLTIAATRPLVRKWNGGLTFTLTSGMPTSLPVSRYVVDGFVLAEYGPRNSGRLPAYHRLDLNVTRQFRRSELQFGVLNAYNRFNAQALRFRQDGANPLQTQAVQTAIFGVVPSVLYVVHF
jgi:hypothetical protein